MSGNGIANVTKLISSTWTTSDLLNAIDGGTPTDPTNAPTIDSINAHFDFGRLLSANGDTTGDNSQILDTTQVRDADPGNEITQERLLFSLGCHSGLDIPTNEIENDVPGGVDSWASVFADEGAIWVGNTGYGYANDQYISYSAKLMGLFAQSLNGSLSIGDALSEAKQLYAAQTGVLDPYDLKADMESTYYGMPNYTLSGLTNPATNSASATPSLSLGTDPATGLQTASISLSQSVGSGNNQLGTVTPPEGGTYYEVNNSTLEQTTAGFPIEPLSSIDVTIPGANGGLASVAHGALITGLTSTDVGNFTPSIAEADSDTSGPENQISQYETSFPATLQRVATYQLFSATGAPVTHQAVDLITGQFVPDPNNPGTGNQRLFTNVAASVEYTPPSDTHFTPPTINEATGVVVNNSTAAFNVVTTPAPGGSPVKEVLVLFTDTANPGAWTPVTLTQGADGSWTGGAPAPADGEISYIIQAVDGDGNVAMDSNKGIEFNQVQESQVQSTGLGGTGLTASLSGSGSPASTQVDGFFNGPVKVTFTGAPDATVTYQVDGGSSQTVDLGSDGQNFITVNGDGTHVITASDIGNQISQVVQIDTTPPTISSSVSAPKSGNGWTSAPTTLTLSASDAGSGVASLSYSVNGGPPTTVTGESTQITPVPAGVTTYTVTATDLVGNTSSPTTVTTYVDTTTPTASVTFPANGGTYNASAWTNGGTSPCGASGTICGQATDTGGSGISGPGAITLTITGPGGTTWNGTSFTPGANTVNPTSYNPVSGQWTYTFPTGNLVPDGTYSVAVQTTGAVENTSSVATNTFVFDNTPPSVSVAYPVSGTTYGANWNGTISGTASASNGATVTAVGVAIENTTTGKWWSGSSFSGASADYVPVTTGTTSWTLSFGASNLTTGDAYSVTAQATDSATNVGTSTASTFTYSTAAPGAADHVSGQRHHLWPQLERDDQRHGVGEWRGHRHRCGRGRREHHDGQVVERLCVQRDEPDLRTGDGDDGLVLEPERLQPGHR